ncbi:PhoH family protein [Fimbriiglobus ruber]|uniref:Phosphate starvation-inducible protein PhoH, predicted ATPase n=1 Tax=Fimbriiglobus ruber TaxID=1908690 RepID=A0A225DCX4_9BACT|nr:PhoH family protein [Fimbriiglobus ruber]OWK34255.1 Phosphate starvation-inducible protein PhoH, predicted ATPase [Fimbriiglobus ruber]
MTARTPGQRPYLAALRNPDYQLLFVTGPAGTGKTFLAASHALQQLQRGEIRRIVLVRPTVTCGGELGYHKGDLGEKVGPYFAPLLDALCEYLGDETGAAMDRLIESRQVIISPLQYLRGSTLRGACVILDEGQNATEQQMFMLLTRPGDGTRVIVTGDLEQTDLPARLLPGLPRAVERLRGGLMGHVRLGPADIVRSPLVQQVVSQW